MRKPLSISVLGTVLAAAVPAGAIEWNGFYIRGDVGAVMQQELSIDSEVTSSSSEMSFGTGIRGNVEFGGRFARQFDLGLASGILWNSIDKVAEDSASSSTLMQIPVLANLTYRLPLSGRWLPYIGAGAGGVMSLVDLSTPIGKLNASDFTFAYQASVGLNYVFSERAEFGIAYQFLSTGDHDWSDGGVTLKTDGSISHALVASFNWKF